MSTEQTTRAKRTFKTFSYRGVDLKDLLELSHEEFTEIVHARIRRKFLRGISGKPKRFIQKLHKAKTAAGPNEKPSSVRTHLRNMVILPEMIGSVVEVYNGKSFTTVEIKPEMVGHYLGEFSITYRPVGHKRPGVSGTGSRFMPLK